MYIHTHTHTHIYIYLYTHTHTHTHTHIYISFPKDVCVCNHNPTKMAHHSKILNSAIHLKCSNLKNKSISHPICN